MIGFVCEIDQTCRTACEGLPFYASHEGKAYCVLHYPGSEDKALDFEKIVNQKVENNDYNFRGAWFPYSTGFLEREVIETDADFSFATFNKELDPDIYEDVLDEDFLEPIVFRDAEFKAKAHFQGTKFCTDTDFSGVEFGKRVDFSQAVFASKAVFEGVTFEYSAKFREAIFGGDVDFSGSKFLRNPENWYPEDMVIFTEARFDGNAEFSEVTIDATSVLFLSAYFCGTVDFDRADFCQSASVFKNAEFHQGVWFTDAAFGANTWFTGTKFLGEADFCGTKLHNADFRESSFALNANFELATFGGDRCYFTGLTFGKDVDFSHTTFDCPVHYATTVFGGEAEFSKAVFEGVAIFKEARFLHPVRFREANFGGFANFTEATFENAGSVVFQDATFATHVNFDEVQFGSKASFLNATFEGPAWFSRTIFVKEVHCEGASFRKEARFLGAKFVKGLDFSRAEFLAEAQFTMAEFELHPIFHYVTFGGRTTFAGVIVKDAISFVEADFQDKVLFSGTQNNRLFGPESSVDFRDVRVERPELVLFDTVMLRPHWLVGLDVSRLNFTNVSWYGLLDDPKGSLRDEIDAFPTRYKESRHELLAKTCRELYSNYEEKRDYKAAGEFHYWSMEALREKSWKRLGLIGSLYWALSGYGERPKRAFFVLVGLWMSFAILYMIVGHYSLRVFPIDSFWQTLESFGQSLVYSLAALARLSPVPVPEKPGLFQFAVTIEGILGPLQIALLALAIRRKVMR